jgi:hypothetical protein
MSGIAALFPSRGAGGSVGAGLAVVSWESGTFPMVSAAGISVLPLP